ncbi:SAICAR synthase-like protein [Calocera cornea HHB12733]|uniref:Kinase n=1 Tax=Calocera cornea HHB12733 TaxID=1353952 RepID=A0A165HVC1_9BASI|nr:SAICAR synthase-like protein [Calocera cornea HHB12733]
MAAQNGSIGIVSIHPGTREPAAGPSSVPLQVGGHPGAVETSADGSFVIKSALPGESVFYSALASEPALAQLREWVPQFYGTLRLEGQMLPGGELVPAPSVGETGAESVVLENVVQYFLKGNVCDVKMGKVLWDEDASEDKRARMELRARETTSAETGIRLTGFHVYNRLTNRYTTYPKSYGYSLTAAQLPQGISAFFPLALSPSDPGLPPDLLVSVLQGVEDDVEELTEVLAATEVRVVGGSVLLVYEGEERALREALRKQEELKARADAEATDAATNADEEDEEMEEDEEESEPEETPNLPWIVRLIDFAHTRCVPGQGPDEGLLFGLRTLLRLLKGRREEVQRLASGGAGGMS